MPTVSPLPWIPARYFDDNGDPLEGGKLYAFLAGTDTPQATYHDPAGTVQNPHPVVADDAGYMDVYLISGASYKLRLDSATDVQQWTADQVVPPGTGSGGAFTTAPIVLQAVPGAQSLVAPAAWQPGWRQIGVTARVTQAFGQSQGLQSLAIGDAVQFDRWGYCAPTLDAQTTAADFLTGDSPWTSVPTDVLVTPFAGAFDSAGQLELTLWYSDLGIAPPVPEPEPPPLIGPGGVFMSPPLVLNVVGSYAPLVAEGAWHAGWMQLGVTAEVTVAFSPSAGLTSLAIGDSGQFDRWGYCALTLGSTTDATDFLTGDSPWTPAPMDVLVTPIGGLFAAIGQITLRLHYLTIA